MLFGFSGDHSWNSGRPCSSNRCWSRTASGMFPYSSEVPAVSKARISSPRSTMAWSRFRVPRKFTAAVSNGRVHDSPTCAWAARWNTTGFVPRRAASADRTACMSVTSPSCTVIRSRRCPMLFTAPLEVARTNACTLAPASTRASVRWDPMNPSAPVTRQVFPATVRSASPSTTPRLSIGRPRGVEASSLALHVRGHHQAHQALEVRERTPSQRRARLRRIPPKLGDIGGSNEGFVVANERRPVIHADLCERRVEEVTHAVGHPGCDHEIVSLRALQHHPHSLDVLGGIAPVPPDVEVTEDEALLKAEPDAGDTSRDLPRHELLATSRRLVVEQDPADREHAVNAPVVDGGVMGEHLGHSIRMHRRERGVLVLGEDECASEHLGTGCLVEACTAGPARQADGLEQTERPQAGDFRGELGLRPRAGHRGQRSEVVHLVRTGSLHDGDERGQVLKVPFNELDGGEELGDGFRLRTGSRLHHAEDAVPASLEHLGQVRAVLSGDARDESSSGWHVADSLLPSGPSLAC